MITSESLLKLRELLGREDKITILVGRNPNLDSMAAATALYLAFSKAGKSVSIVCKTEPIVELSSLVGIDKVSQKLSHDGRDLTMILPYQKGRIEKISYNIEGDKIQLMIKAGSAGLGFEKEDIQFSKNGGVTTGFVFLVGVANSGKDLLDFYNEETLKEIPVVNVSEFEDQSASSISETIAAVLNNLSAPIDIDIAQNLMTGISWATDNFQSEKTTPLAFEMAGFLLKYGVKRQTGPASPDASFAESRRVSQGGPVVKSSTETVEIKKDDRPPLDWLTPKIYKGSTLP